MTELTPDQITALESTNGNIAPTIAALQTAYAQYLETGITGNLTVANTGQVVPDSVYGSVLISVDANGGTHVVANAPAASGLPAGGAYQSPAQACTTEYFGICFDQFLTTVEWVGVAIAVWLFTR